MRAAFNPIDLGDMRVMLIYIIMICWSDYYEVHDDDYVHDDHGNADGDLLDSGVSFCQVSFFMNFSTERPPVYLVIIVKIINMTIMKI